MYLASQSSSRRTTEQHGPTTPLSGGGDGSLGLGYVDGNLRMMECITRTYDSSQKEPHMALVVKFGPEGVVAVGYSDGVIKIYNPDTGQCLHSLSDDDCDKKKVSPVTCIRFKPPEDGKVEHKHILIATYVTGEVKFWHYTSQTCLSTITEDRFTLYADISGDLLRLATAGVNAKLQVYDVETKQRLRTLEASDSRDVMNGHRDRVFTLKYFLPEPHLFVTGGWDDTVQFWDDREEHSIRRIYGPHICGDALDIDFSHNHIVTGSWRMDSPLQIWDFYSGDIIRNVPQDPTSTSLLYCAEWLGTDYIACGGSQHNMARVIDRGTLNTVGQLVDLPKAVFSLSGDDSVPNRPRLAIASAHKVYIVRVEKRQ